jgi:endonuclease/exonuclease/phosphatase family metal-dependent hydrolase
MVSARLTASGKTKHVCLLLKKIAAISTLVVSVFVAGTHIAGTAEGHDRQTALPASTAGRTPLRVMTFNIRWQGKDYLGKFHDSGFEKRRPLILDVLTGFGADIIGLQEASIEQRASLAPGLAAFGMFPPPDSPGDECILYRLDRFDLVDSGHAHLRQQPEKAGTNIGVRDFFWVYLRERFGGKAFYVLNLHMDHRSSKRGRQLDAVLVGEWIGRREYDAPVILTGDFNGQPGQPRYSYLTGKRTYLGKYGKITGMPMPMLDSFMVANPHAKYTGTSNPDYTGRKNTARIDFVFVPVGTTVTGSDIIYYHVGDTYPSDHFPLLSEFELE